MYYQVCTYTSILVVIQESICDSTYRYRYRYRYRSGLIHVLYQYYLVCKSSMQPSYYQYSSHEDQLFRNPAYRGILSKTRGNQQYRVIRGRGYIRSMVVMICSDSDRVPNPPLYSFFWPNQNYRASTGIYCTYSMCFVRGQPTTPQQQKPTNQSNNQLTTTTMGKIK